MSRSRHSLWARPGGFTLVEMLVAVAVGALMITLLVAITASALQAFRRTNERLKTEADAAVALDYLSSDIEGLSALGFENIRVVSETVHASSTARLALLADLSSKDAGYGRGNTRAISYRLGWQNPIDGSSSRSSFGLYRAEASAEETLKATNGAIGATNLITSFWQSRDANTLSPENLLIENVAVIDVRAIQDTATNAIPPAEVSSGRQGISVNDQPADAKGRLAEVEITLKILTPSAAILMEKGSLTLERALAEYSHSYTRRVVVPSGN